MRCVTITRSWASSGRLRRRRPEGRLPQAGHGAPPRPQRRLRRGRGPLQGNQRGLFGPVRPAEARGLRPLRPCRASTAAAAAAAGGGFHDVNDIFNEVFGDVFGDMFGGRRRPASAAARRRGQDLRYDLEITLEQAYAGAEVEIAVPAAITCETCEGSGAKPGTSPTTCTTCGGAGPRARQPRASSRSSAPARAAAARAGWCSTPATTCHGHGQVRRERTLQVRIPAGVDDGARIRLAGEGDAGAARRPARRPLHLPVGEAARAVRARRPGPALHRAGADDGRGPGRRDRGALPAGRRELRRPVQGPGQGARGRPDRQDRAPQGPGHAVACGRASAATWWSSCSSRPRPS